MVDSIDTEEFLIDCRRCCRLADKLLIKIHSAAEIRAFTAGTGLVNSLLFVLLNFGFVPYSYMNRKNHLLSIVLDTLIRVGQRRRFYLRLCWLYVGFFNFSKFKIRRANSLCRRNKVSNHSYNQNPIKPKYMTEIFQER